MCAASVGRASRYGQVCRRPLKLRPVRERADFNGLERRQARRVLHEVASAQLPPVAERHPVAFVVRVDDDAARRGAGIGDIGRVSAGANENGIVATGPIEVIGVANDVVEEALGFYSAAAPTAVAADVNVNFDVFRIGRAIGRIEAQRLATLIVECLHGQHAGVELGARLVSAARPGLRSHTEHGRLRCRGCGLCGAFDSRSEGDAVDIVDRRNAPVEYEWQFRRGFRVRFGSRFRRGLGVRGRRRGRYTNPS